MIPSQKLRKCIISLFDVHILIRWPACVFFPMHFISLLLEVQTKLNDFNFLNQMADAFKNSPKNYHSLEQERQKTMWLYGFELCLVCNQRQICIEWSNAHHNAAHWYSLVLLFHNIWMGVIQKCLLNRVYVQQSHKKRETNFAVGSRCTWAMQNGPKEHIFSLLIKKRISLSLNPSIFSYCMIRRVDWPYLWR